MRYPNYVRTAAAVTAAVLMTVAQAQSKTPVLTDTAPLPAEERSSVGAVVLMDQPVLAQRAMIEQQLARSVVDTRMMGAGPARVLRQVTPQEDGPRPDRQGSGSPAAGPRGSSE